MGSTSRVTRSGGHDERRLVSGNDARRSISRRRFLTTAAAAAAGSVAAVRGVTARSVFAAAAQTGGTLVYAVDQPITKLDPNLDAHRTNEIVFYQIFDPLIVRDKRDNKFKPWLARSWDVSADGRAYTLHLRAGITFHDGTPFNAEAVKFNFDRVHNPALASQATPTAVGFYESTEVIDPLTARVHLKSPWGPFLDALSFSYRMVSPAGVQKVGDKDFGRHPVGSGPFRFVEWVENQQVVLERSRRRSSAGPAGRCSTASCSA
jgi:peptide/nickel transport system substrate-binding protein